MINQSTMILATVALISYMLLLYFRLIASALYVNNRVRKRYFVTALIFPLDVYFSLCEEYNVPSMPYILSILYIVIVLVANPAIKLMTGMDSVLPIAALYPAGIGLVIITITIVCCNIYLLNDLSVSVGLIILGLLCPPMYEIILNVILWKKIVKKGLI